MIPICNYGCGQEARFQFKNGKWCCSPNFRSCPERRKMISGEQNPNFGNGDKISGDKSSSKRLEVRLKLSQSRIGIPPWNKGKVGVYTEEGLLARSLSAIGERHWNWKGGISCEPYCEVWSDREYKNWIKYERDRGKCQNPQCRGVFVRLCLHHINYIKKDCKPTNLITLCNPCNVLANKDRKWHEAFYNEIMRRKLIGEENAESGIH